MPEYRIFETEQFKKDLKKITRGALPRIEEKLNVYTYPQLKDEPHFGLNIKRLKGYDPPTWRYRVGDWRFFYEIDDARKIVFMTTADGRGSAY